MMKREALLLVVLLSTLRPNERTTATATRPVRLENVDDWTEDELLDIGDEVMLKNILKRRGKEVKQYCSERC